MKLILWVFIVCYCGLQFVNCHDNRIPPGVPPQQYQQNLQMQQHGQFQQPSMHQPQVPTYQQQVPIQQQVPMQQQQQVNMQQQQVPVHQQQQVPVHQQQQAPTQQQPHGHGHNHGQPQQILNAANIAQEKEHMQEHMEVPLDTSKMTDQELQFHYFKMHDADNNNKLDGCELIKSLIHWHEQGHKETNTETPEEKIFKEDELEALIDPILSMDDVNRDGFIDYPEFVQAQQKAAANGGRQ